MIGVIYRYYHTIIVYTVSDYLVCSVTVYANFLPKLIRSSQTTPPVLNVAAILKQVGVV